MYEFKVAAEGAAGVFEALAEQVAPVLSAQQAQGDLLFDPTCPAPEAGALVGDRIQNVAPGGVMLTPDGHPHVAVPSGPVRWDSTQAWWGVIGVLSVPTGSTVTVLHEDPGPDGHAPLFLAPGTYEVVRQRQWQPVTRPRRAATTARTRSRGSVAAAERYRRAGPLMRLFPYVPPTFAGLPIIDVEVC